MRGKVPYALTAALAALMVVQPVLGFLFQGAYRDVAWIKETWFGNDWVTLAAAVPLLVIAVLKARRDSVRAMLAWLGTTGYAAYNYAFYLFGAALNVFFPLYVIGVVLSVVTLILALSRVDVTSVAASFRSSTPVRAVGGYFAFVGCGLVSVWLAMWAAYVFAGRPTPVEPEAFKLVAALDLSVMATTLTIGGVLLWRSNAWGFIVSAIAGVQASLYLVVLSVNSMVAIQSGRVATPGELPLWGTLALLTTSVTVMLLMNSRPASNVVSPSRM